MNTTTPEAIDGPKRRFLAAALTLAAAELALARPAGAQQTTSNAAGFIHSLGRADTQGRMRLLFDQGFHKPGDAENRLGDYLEQISG